MDKWSDSYEVHQTASASLQHIAQHEISSSVPTESCDYWFILESSCSCSVSYIKCLFMSVTLNIVFHKQLWIIPVQAEHYFVKYTTSMSACTVKSKPTTGLYVATHIHAHTYTWRAAHLANRPHYMGGWTIDLLVEELKKSPFSSPRAGMCDMMSWSYLPALCSMTANLTCSPKMAAKIPAAKSGAHTCLKYISLCMEATIATVTARTNNIV